MRIRKHAAKILSSLSIPAQSCATAAAAAAGGRELEMHVCELNQSPWDAMDFTAPLGTGALYLCQEVEEMEEENGVVWGAAGSGQREEEAAAVSDVSGVTTAQLITFGRHVKTEETTQGAEEEDKRERKIGAKKMNPSNNTKKIKRRSASACGAVEGSAVEKVKVEVESATTAVTCKKSDGKGWHCKREAQHPHSLCEYHLTQVRSYYSNGGGTTHVLQQQQSFRRIPGGSDAKQNAAVVQAKKIMKKKIEETEDCNGNKGSIGSKGATGRTRRKPASDFYYYYSGFGPWWGKRRSGGGGGDSDGRNRLASNVNASDGCDEGVGASDAAPSLLVHDQAPDDLDDDDDDLDDVDDLGGYDGNDVVATKRRGRKPVKARSLKSLL